MPADRRYFSVLDTDTAPELVQNGKAAALRNVQPERGYAVGVRGNELVEATLPAGRNYAVGGCDLPGGGGAVWLNHNSEGRHHLVRWQPESSGPKVLLTWQGLNLPAPEAHAYVPVCVLETYVLYLDRDGEARCLPLKRCEQGYYTPALLASQPYCLHLLKVPPMQAPTLERIHQPGVVGNQIEGHAWQAAARYRYLDGETTVFSPLSLVSDAQNQLGTDVRNMLRITLANSAPDLVAQVEFLVRRDQESVWLVAQTIGRDHLLGLAGAPLQIDFTGVTSGEAVSSADAARLSEALWPAKALSIARNRVWVANTREGYHTPDIPVRFQAEASAEYYQQIRQQVVYEVQRQQLFKSTVGNGSVSMPHTRYYVLQTGAALSPGSTYQEVYPLNNPTMVDSPSVIYSCVNTQILTYEQAFTDPVYKEVAGSNKRYIRNSRTILPLRGRALRSGGTYYGALQFFDWAGRPCGATTPQAFTVYETDYAAPIPFMAKWELLLDGRDENDLIPAWVNSYAVLLSTDASVTDYRQGLAADVLAYLGRNSDNTPILDLPTRAHTKLWVDIGNWPLMGHGYVWEAGRGDRLRFVNDNIDVPITGQEGDYVEVEWSSSPAGHAGGVAEQKRFLRQRIEIYTPASASAQTVLYQYGPRYLIEKQADGKRRFGAREGVLPGDCWQQILPWPVIGYNYEDTSTYSLGDGAAKPGPIKKSYSTTRMFATQQLRPLGRPTGMWLNASRGRPAQVLPLALQQVELRSGLRFSDLLLPGTQTNGLNAWQPLNQHDLPNEQGPIQALALGSDVQAEGSVLVALCQNGVESIGIGVSRVRQSDGGSLVTESDQVVGYTNPMRGAPGTRHPRSVVAVAGRIYYWSEAAAEVCRYAADGVNRLNSQSACRQLGREWRDGFGALPDVLGGYDPISQEYVLRFAAGAAARTERYSERAGPERAGGFVGRVDYAPELMLGGGGGRFASVKQGQLWEHSDEAPRLSWYGRAYAATVSQWFNEAGPYSKTWQSFVQEGGPVLWELTDARTLSGQRTRLPAARVERLEEKFYGALLLDMTTPGFGYGPEAERRALYEGLPVQGLALLATLRCESPSPEARLVATTLTYVLNSGQSAPS